MNAIAIEVITISTHPLDDPIFAGDRPDCCVKMWSIPVCHIAVANGASPSRGPGHRASPAEAAPFTGATTAVPQPWRQSCRWEGGSGHERRRLRQDFADALLLESETT